MDEEQELPEQGNAGGNGSGKTGRSVVRVLFVTADSDLDRATALGNRRRFSVRTASADEVLDVGDIDCLVCTYRLADGNGLDLLADIRNEYDTLPFVLVSDEEIAGLAEKALSNGATDYVYCPPAEGVALLAHRVRVAVDSRDDKADESKPVIEDDQAEGGERHDELRRIYRALETAQEGISLLDADGRFVNVNDTYADLYGYNPDEMLGMHWEAIYPDDEVRKVYNDILPGVDKGGNWSGETTGLRADGSTFIEDHSLSKTAGGGLVCTIRDITAEREREQLVERYRSVVEDAFGESEVGVFILDSSSKVVWSNQAVTDYFGLEGITADGKEMTGLVERHLKHRVAQPEAFTERVIGVYEGNASDEVFEVHVQPEEDRDERYLQHRSQPIDSGKYAGGRLELYYDITERKRREQELHRSKERLEAAMTVGSVGTWDWNIGDDEMVADAALADLFGIDPELAQDGIPLETFLDSIHEGDREEAEAAIERTLETGDELEMEYRVRNADGEVRWVMARGKVEYDGDGTPVCFSGALSDVTERKKREEKLEQFANVLSHDLRNPLAIAQMYLGEARRNGDEESFDEIEQAHTRMETMIENLLSMARGNQSSEECLPISFETVAERAWSQTETTNASLHVAEFDGQVVADSDRLQAAFENLFRNAIEHGGTDVSVRIGRLDDGFYVADSGPGIPPEKREAVLKYGYSDSNGTGFGLGIVNEVIDAHGWGVSVTEASDGGARFEVRGVEFDAANTR